ncbi:MAG: hypothetical protein GFH27_549305n179 [Chloroflexi bacterium AL-W]|nr:hypothetical protein [Chloroflexi bacterium AL-N1]NOK71197.1 hypothetical protein [Chloroflexi bacterium AL-N10]NOK76486.1 hypothetical protein [Chloroflexi bacterium AL-N5]NOK83603.1 hypothetical protein [Chloroflexi bacterium AL-W]NOK92275.1 hypothetical protein [Chloroflexi bacterium AL-N15]
MCYRLLLLLCVLLAISTGCGDLVNEANLPVLAEATPYRPEQNETLDLLLNSIDLNIKSLLRQQQFEIGETQTFTTSLSLDAVTTFYVEELTSSGWIMDTDTIPKDSSQRLLVYRREEELLVVVTFDTRDYANADVLIYTLRASQ